NRADRAGFYLGAVAAALKAKVVVLEPEVERSRVRGTGHVEDCQAQRRRGDLHRFVRRRHDARIVLAERLPDCRPHLRVYLAQRLECGLPRALSHGRPGHTLPVGAQLLGRVTLPRGGLLTLEWRLKRNLLTFARNRSGERRKSNGEAPHPADHLPRSRPPP